MKLTLEALEAIDAIERNGSYAAAAERLHKVPSAISYIIQKLEADLGVTVFDRSGHRAKLTNTGRLLLQEGRHLLLAAADLECRAGRIESGWEAELRIAFDTIVPFAAIVPYVTAFYGERTATRLAFRQESLGGMWDALVTRRVDLAIGACGDPPVSGLACLPIDTLEWVYCVSPAHLLAAEKEPLSARKIAEYRVVVLADTAHLPLHRYPLAANDGDTVTAPTIEAGLALLVAGLGGGYLPACVARKYLDQGLLIKKELAAPIPPQQFHVAWHVNDDGAALKWWLRQLERSELIAEMWRT